MIQRYQVGSRMSQAVKANGFVFIAGQVADDRKAGIEAQTRDVLAKIEQLLAEAGCDKSKLVAVNVFLPHIADFDAMNRVYDAWIDSQHPAARACVEARLADPDLRVEMTAVAVL
jgi:enamine deaminase RidA (YjgF/YER057c/UK114 family)